MKVVIDDLVVEKIDAFYDAAMGRHITLGEETVMHKKNRLISSLKSLGDYPALYAKARLAFDEGDIDTLNKISASLG